MPAQFNRIQVQRVCERCGAISWASHVWDPAWPAEETTLAWRRVYAALDMAGAEHKCQAFDLSQTVIVAQGAR